MFAQHNIPVTQETHRINYLLCNFHNSLPYSDFGWGYWNFFSNLVLLAALWP
jgi:hypothetical protein